MGFLRRLFGGSAEPPTPTERRRIDHRAKTLPADHERLVQGPPVEVHGESHHRAEIEEAVGRRAEGHDDIVDAMLVWEPDNPWDPNAIAVQIDGRTCGYLPRLDAKRYRPVMEWARSQGFVPVARADVTGGWQFDDGTWADFGVRLYLAAPHNILGQPEPPPPVPSRNHPWVGQTIAFTGDSRCVIAGERLDRARSEEFARAAGIEVHERVTKKVQLLVDCDDETVSGNQRKAIEYGIEVLREPEFWAALGLEVETI